MVEKSHTAGWLPNVYEPLKNIGQRVADWFAPRSDASSMTDCYEINIELPGVAPENVDVTVQGDSLIVQGEKQSRHEEKGRTYFFSEREYGLFQRSFRVPPDSDADNIEATFKDGILSLRIAKRSASDPSLKKVDIRRA